MRYARSLRTALVLALVGGLTACPKDRDPIAPDEEEPDPLVITTMALPAGAVGEEYTAGIDAQGGSGNYAWTISSGTLPPGLDLSIEDLVDNDVLVTGVPTSEGMFTFGVRVTSDDGQQESRSFSIQVLGEPAPVGIANVALGPGLVGAAYDMRLTGTGGDGAFTFSLAGGTLPPGLTLTTGGRLHGTPSAPDTSMILIRVESGGLDAEKAFTLQVVANRTATFDITAAPVVAIPGAIRPQVDAALARWQSAITADLAQAAIPLSFFDPGDCGGFGTVVNGTSADDLIVLINIVSIDGPGDILGQAGPCVIRGNNLPFAGVLTLDADDLGTLSDQAKTDLIVHELGHVLGYGSLWDVLGLLTESTSDPRFTGPSAVAEWNALGGAGAVPVENTGGEGTARSHWRETVFKTELMTGFSSPNTVQPLSRVSIASLADLGYAVNLGAADAFTLGSAMAAPEHDPQAAHGYDVVLDDTIYRVEDDGSVTTIRLER